MPITIRIYHKSTQIEPISKIWIRVQGKARGGSKVVCPSIREYTVVREHFKPIRNTALGT
jgi:hypothetical protein